MLSTTLATKLIRGARSLTPCGSNDFTFGLWANPSGHKGLGHGSRIFSGTLSESRDAISI